ncbi:hypothetical protein Tco_1482221 [Tanacetum coccineum]
MAKKLNINKSLPLPQHDPSLPKLTKRKKKPMEQEHERVSGIHKVETATLLGYKMMAFYEKTPSNQNVVALMDKMILERPDKHTIALKKAKLEMLGYKEE